MRKFFSTVSYLPFFAPDDAGSSEDNVDLIVLTPEQKAAQAAKTAADKKQAERDSIKITSTTTPEPTEEEKAAKEVEEKAAVEAAAKEAAAKVDDSTKTEEELEAEKAAAKTQREQDKIQKRIDREVAKRKILEAEIVELKAKLASDPEKATALTEEEVEKRAEAKATQKQVEREFVAACNRLADAGAKADKDFKKKVDAMAEDIGPIPGQMIGVLDDLDNGGEVLSYLTNNVDQAEEIYSLSPAKMAVELTKLSTKIEAEKKPKPKQISKVPDPAETLGGNNKGVNEIVLRDNEPMSDWVRKRNEQVRRRQEAKRAGMR